MAEGGRSRRSCATGASLGIVVWCGGEFARTNDGDE